MTPTDEMARLWAAVESYDAEAVDVALADLLASRPLASAITDCVLPFLVEVGDRWEAGTLSVAHEHFFTSLLTRRLAALTPATPPADGPVVVLACPPGERHEIVLFCFGLLLGERGFRVRFLGADTPVPAMVAAVRASSADALVVAATRRTALTSHATALHKLAERHAVHVAGNGADEEVARLLGASLLPPDPTQAVEVLLGSAQAAR